MPPGAFTSADDLLGENRDQRRIVLHHIGAGEPILAGKISKLGEPPRVAMQSDPDSGWFQSASIRTPVSEVSSSKAAMLMF